MKIEERLVRTLTARSLSLCTAESCTGGLIAGRITAVPGASACFEGGVVTYSNRAKAILLGVPVEVIEDHGAVSEEVARAMAEGARERLGTDIAVAVTGIAGPAGGSPEKPVGTVFISLAVAGMTSVRGFRFEGTRREIRRRSGDEVLHFVLDHLEGKVNG
ncbi:MAG TPA: nicotinamide-nucleotide amidohydrolase family protein [Syntrophorhabdaceae bacterium]|nr:nicotinamide-nucleotide amidohydrolase family protein [Syntrophorhabdaceae bacterium]HOD76397.1 nicotinamide-nucleotide amidohydrolase family protein [Syntrophorhabdaceae bacterium]